MEKKQRTARSPVSETTLFGSDIWKLIASYVTDGRTLLALTSGNSALRLLLGQSPEWKRLYYMRFKYFLGIPCLRKMYICATRCLALPLSTLNESRSARKILAFLWSRNPMLGKKYHSVGPVTSPCDTLWVSYGSDKLTTAKWVIGLPIDRTTYSPQLYGTFRGTIRTGSTKITDKWYQEWVIEQGFKFNLKIK